MEATLKQLETREITLVQSLELVDDGIKYIEHVQGPLAVAVTEKMINVLNKNSDLNCLKLIRNVLCRINGILWQTELTPFDIVNRT